MQWPVSLNSSPEVSSITPDQARSWRVNPIFGHWQPVRLIPKIALEVGCLHPDEREIKTIIGSFLLTPMRCSPILVVGWTLIHEMFFYLLFATLIFAKGKWAKFLFLLWSTSLLINFINCFNTPTFVVRGWLNMILWPQNIEFLMGSALAIMLSLRTSVRL